MYLAVIRSSAAVILAWGLTLAWWVEAARSADLPQALPAFGQVEEIVLRHFALLPGYRPGDIVARGEVEPVFAQLERVGWKVADCQEILSKVPGDNDYLVRMLRTPRGRQFMHRIAGYPDAYDRLERLSWLPYGRQTVHDLIYKTGGEEMIKYLTTAGGGKQLGRMLSGAPKGVDFNKPTGRFYTADLLLARLKRSYAAALQSASRENVGKK